MKPEKQTVYLPVKVEEDTNTGVFVKYIHSGHKYPVKEQKAFVFTPEQLNEYTKEVIKQALETAAENAKINYKEDGGITKVKSKKLDIDYLSEVSAKVSFNINKESITKTFEGTFKKFKV